MTNINWLESWYAQQHNGDWEHTYGIKIKTLDNPGWHLEIDLQDTDFVNCETDFVLNETSENNWFGTEIKNNKFTGVGDASKLDFLIGKFREFIEN